MQTARAAALAPQRPALRASRSSSRRCALVVRSSSAAGAPGAPQLPSAGLLRLTAAAAALVQRGVAAAKAAAAQAARQVAEEDLNAQIKASVKQMRMLAVVAPLAAVSGGAGRVGSCCWCRAISRWHEHWCSTGLMADSPY